mmetsp:Transcript_44862/g.71270  ORF Transcript_44862/g.71270 Transcript_44862/m.71270 type:complete len:241 (-) Transcript_44862:90-812(-)
MFKQSLHLLCVQLFLAVSLAHHDLVVRASHFERLLHKHAIDDTNDRETNGDFMGDGEGKVPFAHLVLQNPRNHWPVAQRKLKHAQNSSRACAKVGKDFVAIRLRIGTIQQIGGAENLIQKERDHNLRHEQQDEGPEQNRHTALHGSHHQVEGVETMNHPNHPHKTEETSGPRQTDDALVHGLKPRLAEEPQCHHPGIEPVPEIKGESLRPPSNHSNADLHREDDPKEPLSGTKSLLSSWP